MVKSDDGGQRSLQKIVALSEKIGAEFRDDMKLKCFDGFLSVEAPPEVAGKVLARLPWNCLVPLPSFHLSVATDDIVISSHDESNASIIETHSPVRPSSVRLYNFDRCFVCANQYHGLLSGI